MLVADLGELHEKGISNQVLKAQTLIDLVILDNQVRSYDINSSEILISDQALYQIMESKHPQQSLSPLTVD